MGARYEERGNGERGTGSTVTGSTVTGSAVTPLWRNRIAHSTSNRGVVGSSPTKGIREHGKGAR